MKKKRQTVPLAMISLNTGQLAWLPKNPRQWTATDIERTASSITEDPDFLEDRPLLVTPLPAGGFVAFAGNLRHEGAVKAGLTEVPCVVYRPENGQDYDTIKRRAMKDNGSFGSWDYDTLANEWDDLPLADWGVPAWETEKLNASPTSEAKEDEFDEDKDEIHVLCAKGDVWQLGDHRLMCGDSVDLEQVKKLMGGVKSDLLITDPPYGVAIGSKNKMLQEKVGVSNQVTEDIKNDTLSVDELYKILSKAMENGRISCKDDASYFVFSPPGGDMGLMMMMMMRDAGLTVRHQLVWNKNAATFSLGRLDYDYKHEAIMYTWTKNHHNYRNGQFRNTVWDVDKPLHCDLHPTMKPIPLLSAMMLDCSKEGDVILDLFGGSGSTMIAAEQLGRKAYLMEIDPHYCDVILSRWEKFTGKKAELLNGEVKSNRNYE